MSGFSFGDNIGASQSKVGTGLEGNAIHEVKFDGAEKVEFANRTGGDPYKVLRLKFSNDEGNFEHTIFEPREEDHERRISEFTDQKTGKPVQIPNASNVESMMLLFKHTIDSVLPALGEKIDNKEFSLGGKNWEALKDNLVAIFEKGIGAETSIKLLKDKNGYAQFPRYFARVNADGKAYMGNNFIGKKLGFSPAEIKKMDQVAKAKPTAMNMDEPIISDLDEGDDLDDLDMEFEVGQL